MAEAPGASPELRELADVRARVGLRLAGVGRTIAVMSGKGGVGKSLIAVQLALGLARRGLRVALLDADLNSPSVARMLGLRGQPLRATATGLQPIEGPLGVGVQSMDFFLQGEQALAWDGADGEGAPWRSALEHAALADLLGETEWGARDVLVIDLAPGPDRLPALAHVLPALSGALVVTIPTEVSLLSVQRSVRRAREARVALIGLVENLGSAVCMHCGGEGPLFREVPVAARARDLDLELLARVPFDPALSQAVDAGRPLLTAESGAGSAIGDVFERLAERVAAWTPPAQEPSEEGSW